VTLQNSITDPAKMSNVMHASNKCENKGWGKSFSPFPQIASNMTVLVFVKMILPLNLICTTLTIVGPALVVK
jgi:hypothetical protein